MFRKLFCKHNYQYNHIRRYVWEKGGESYDMGFVYICKKCGKNKEVTEIPNHLKDKIEIRDSGILGFTKKII